MKSEVRTVFLLGIFLALSSTQPLWAQLESPCEDHCQINTNLAGIVNAPLNPTAALVTVGWGGVAGVGYNFNKRHAIIAEFMWNRVYPEVNSLQLLRTVLENSNLNAFTDFYVSDRELPFRAARTVLWDLFHRWRRPVCPQYPSFTIGHGFGLWHAMHADMALVGIQLRRRNCERQPNAGQRHIKRAGRERRRRHDFSRGRRALPHLRRGPLSLCTNQEHQHAIRNRSGGDALLIRSLKNIQWKLCRVESRSFTGPSC